VASNAGYLGTQAVIGAVQGAGASGLQYDIEDGRTFTAAGFFEAIGWGAAGGALGGALGGVPGMPAVDDLLSDTLSEGVSSAVGRQLVKSTISVLAQGVAGATSSGLTAILSNVATHHPWHAGLGEAVGLGFGESAVSGVLGEASAAVARSGPQLDALKAKIGDDNIPSITTALESVQKAATRPEAYLCYGMAGFFITAGFSVWGLDAVFGHGET
jgi:hypothetical protein